MKESRNAAPVIDVQFVGNNQSGKLSEKNEIRPASEMTVLGKLLAKPQDWKAVKDGE